MNTLKNVKWNNINLNALFIDKLYQKGVSLSVKEMSQLEEFLFRKPDIEKWDVWIKPSFEMGILFFD